MGTRFWTFLVMFGIGCSSGGGSGGSGGNAVQQCSALLDVTCDRITECVPAEYSGKEACLADAHTTIDCNAAVSVEPSYDLCFDQVQTRPCSSLFPSGPLEMPTSCRDVILVDGRGSGAGATDETRASR